MMIRGFSFSAFAYYSLFALLLVFKAPLILTLAFFGLRLISQLVVTGLALKKLGEKNLLLFTPLFELALIIIDFIIWAILLVAPGKKFA
jgi:uncharacterized membrane protein